MNLTRQAFCIAAFAAIAANAATPEVTSCTMQQDNRHREVTIQYTFTGADAVITLDVQTNYLDGGETKWASIGGEVICNAQGDVWKKVTCDGSTHTISWRPDLSWPDHKVLNSGARAVVTAWALDNTPDYMVVDISAGAQANTQRYYPAADFLPGSQLGQKDAVVKNNDYKVSKLVMRKIMAKDVEWTGGSLSESIPVQLTNNFYIGVFEVTQGQWHQIMGTWRGYFTNQADRIWRPLETTAYNRIRMSWCEWYRTDTSPTSLECEWPNAPYPTSFLGILRTRTGLDFDLPGEFEWEFACRAGHGERFWNDGSQVLTADNATAGNDANLDPLGRYSGNWNVEYTEGPDRNIPASDGATAIVGSYRPNSWGLYDMHGNVWEYTLDCVDATESRLTSLGRVRVVAASDNNTRRILRGGSWMTRYNRVASSCRPFRTDNVQAYMDTKNGAIAMITYGFRVVCRAGLE